MNPKAILHESVVKSLQKVEPAKSTDESVARLLLQKAKQQLAKYESLDTTLAAKYHTTFHLFKKRFLSKKTHDFTIEQDYLDWDMAITGIKEMRAEIRKLARLIDDHGQRTD